MGRYVIVGCGTAGATAADKIRSRDEKGEIIVFSRETAPYYYRPRLPDYIAGRAELKDFTLHSRDWWEERRIDLRSGIEVTRVDPTARTLWTSDGQEVSYDALLLATGARSFIPPVAGADKEGVFALRDLDDADRIIDRAKKTDRAVLIGGGLLGLESGAGLLKRGLKVRVVEFFDRLLPRQMDPVGAAKLQAILEGMGFSFNLGARSKGILGDREAEGLALEDGTLIPGGLVLFSAGIRPNLDLASEMGLTTDKGVWVDDRLRTSQEGVWAAGDLIEHQGRIYGLWPAAMNQGAIAGINMSGGEETYQGTVPATSLKVVGVDLMASGEIDAEGELEAAVFQAQGVYRKMVLKEDRIVGCLFLGLNKGARECQAAMEKGAKVERPLSELVREDFDFAKLLS